MEAGDVKSKDGITRDVFPATYGHSMIKWETRLLLLAGFSKNNSDRVTVRFIDLESHNCGVFETFGSLPTPPSPRFDHTAALHAERYLFIFGECSHSVFYNDIHVLDLEAMEWSQPQMQDDLVTARQVMLVLQLKETDL